MFYHINLQATINDPPKLRETVPLAATARMWYMRNGAQSSGAVRDVNNTYHYLWIGRAGPNAWPPGPPILWICS
jgi:hypothetical protein